MGRTLAQSRTGGDPKRLAGADEGAWSVQEEGSQWAALAVGAARGQSVLDACAGRGKKAAILARAVGAEGSVDACDVMPAKLERLRVELAAEGLRPRETYAVDWRVGSGQVRELYDHVLVDAPCSGIGTVRRRPEIMLRRGGADLAALARIQVAIASRAAAHVRPGGTLTYVVCSVLCEEAEDVVEQIVRARPELVPLCFEAPLAASAATFRLLPHVHGTDGYFIARFAHRSAPIACEG